MELAPHFSMDTSSAAETQRSPEKSTGEKIIEKVLPIVKSYKLVLGEDAADLAVRDLSGERIAQLQEHEAELDLFEELFSEFWRNPGNFKVKVQSHKELDTQNGPRQTFSLRLARKREEHLLSSGQPQNQLAFHVNIAGTESAVDTLYALGLTGKDPHTVLQAFFRQSNDQRLALNTVQITRTDSGAFRAQPQAGIELKYIRGESEARCGGIAFVGTQAHVRELITKVSLPFYAGLERAIIKSSGFKPKKTD